VCVFFKIEVFLRNLADKNRRQSPRRVSRGGIAKSETRDNTQRDFHHHSFAIKTSQFSQLKHLKRREKHFMLFGKGNESLKTSKVYNDSK
jgi:phosphopentomutase